MFDKLKVGDGVKALESKVSQYQQYQFADLRLNPQSAELYCGDKLIPLPVLSFKLLQVLVEAAPSTLTQERLIELVWQDSVVGNETLKQRIKLLRKALKDNALDPRYVGVVRGRGYHLVPEVKILVQAEPARKNYEFVYNSLAPNLSTKAGFLIWKRLSLAMSFVITILLAALYLSNLKIKEQTESPSQLNQFVEQVDMKKLTPAMSYFYKGQSYYQRYKIEDNQIAIQLYQRALSLDPNLAIAHAGLADAYSQGVFQFNAGDSWRALALESAINAVRLAPKSEISYKALGLAEYLNGQLDNAIVSNLKAVELKPNYLQASTNLGFIYREMGQLDLALQWNFKTIQADPFYAPGYLHLAQSYQAQGKNKLAERNYIKALELKPDYQLAKDAYAEFLKANYL